MAKQKEVSCAWAVTCHMPPIHTLFRPRWRGWVPRCQAYCTVAWASIQDVVHVSSSIKVQYTTSQLLMQPVFWNYFLKSLCFYVWCYHIFQKALSYGIFFKSTLQFLLKNNHCFPSILPHSVSRFPLEMLNHCPLSGFTLVLSAIWLAVSQICLEGPQQGQKNQWLLCETVSVNSIEV